MKSGGLTDMTPYTQLLEHDPDNGVYGDCYRTCIACLLDLFPRDVPHFLEKGPESKDWEEATRKWLAGRGLALFTFVYRSSYLLPVERAMEMWNPTLYYTMGGESPRGSNHEVIYRGGTMVHDPTMYSRKGLVGPCDDGNFWINILTPLGRQT